DLVLCRNVLLYFTPEARARTAARLARCLAPGGWLAVAPVELAPALFPGLAVRPFPSAILYQRPAGALRRPSPPPTAPPRGPRAVAPVARARPEAATRAGDRLAEARAAADRGAGAEADR